MKKLSLIFAMAIILLTACNKDSESIDYRGTYKGTYSFLTTQESSKTGTVIITSNPLVENGILLYSILPMQYVSEGEYTTTSNESAVIINVLKMIGVESLDETINNMTVRAVFTGSILNLTFNYEVEILNETLSTEIRVINFQGTKQ